MSSALSSLWPPLLAPAQFLLRHARNGTVTSTRRSRAEQTRLYRRYLSGQSPYPVAVPGTSLHEQGMAFDLVADNLSELGALWERMGGRWGGSSDPVHFEVG